MDRLCEIDIASGLAVGQRHGSEARSRSVGVLCKDDKQSTRVWRSPMAARRGLNGNAVVASSGRAGKWQPVVRQLRQDGLDVQPELLISSISSTPTHGSLVTPMPVYDYFAFGFAYVVH